MLLRVSLDSLLATSHATTVANFFLTRACTVTADQKRQHLLSVRSSFPSMPDLLPLRTLAASVDDFRCYQPKRRPDTDYSGIWSPISQRPLKHPQAPSKRIRYYWLYWFEQKHRNTTKKDTFRPYIRKCLCLISYPD
jgi:hypothetical protein